MYLLILYFLAINVITFFSFIFDKKKSQKGKWRIPESQLLLLSLIGGSLGGLIAMILVKHKTKKLKFIICIPLLLFINLYVFYQIIVRLSLQ